MTHEFDRKYWEQRWRQGGERPATMAESPPNPHLAREVSELVPGTALDAGCGAGAEAIWLASRGWRVTAADISAEALARAAERATTRGVSQRIRWVEADLSVWHPDGQFDLVTTHYAHPSMPQLEFYDRVAGWVAPGGTLLIVGHHPSDLRTSAHRMHFPDMMYTAEEVAAGLDPDVWTVLVAESRPRTVVDPEGHEIRISDAVLVARRQR